ncbi:uncharacterized protein P174DRAFT_462782 [Aspergillus novofumigatus IBT 16806]|uniref:C6 transcription factor (Acr-2) n=1 Tax=Aspergillus novofumigatus (strain IBT 16806) TaxID=1392255 RepID=A0A2I1BYY5_ASPN1|nr:uncharacterized protein P174DRAFT_462782 [Aspergillus novofumigatus IBT 16806]PKX90590.1 hypothetical protein P174DRAFT_462782 [Aspergillus novofumigatus IBT 16806]
MAQPPCKKCKKAGLECFEKRPLRWAEGATYRGKMGTLSAKIASVPSTAVGGNSRTTSTGGQTLARSRNQSVIVGTELKDSKCVCKLFIMYDSNKNPLRNLIPAALGHPVLLMSILALSARHKANAARTFYQSESATHSGLGLQDASYNALQFKYNAIQGLSRALGTARPSQKDIIVASAFLLIFLDLLESGSDKWNFHLEGIKSLMAQFPASQAPRTMTSQDMGTTVQGLRDFILRQIYLYEVRMMLDSTQSFDCHTWASGLLQPHSLTRPLGMLDMVAQSYKFGALIYGRRVLDALTGDTSSQHDLVCDLIRVIDALRSSDSLFKCILWPLFVAGLESQQGAHRHFVAGCLEKFWFETKCLNAVNAGIILRRFWKRQDSGDISSSQWIFNIGQVEGDWLLI